MPRADLMKRSSNHTISSSQALSSSGSTMVSSYTSSVPYMSPYYSSSRPTHSSDSATGTVTDTVTDTVSSTDDPSSTGIGSRPTGSSAQVYTVPYTQTYIITASTTTFTTGVLTTTTETGSSSVVASPITTDYGFYRQVLNPEEGGNNRRNALIGGIIGGVAGLSIILLLLFCYRKRRSLKKGSPDIEKQKPKWGGFFRRNKPALAEKCLNEKVGNSITTEPEAGNAVPSRENKPRFEEPVLGDQGLFSMRESLLGSEIPQATNFQSTESADPYVQSFPEQRDAASFENREMDVVYENTAEGDNSRSVAMNRTKSPTRTSTYTNSKKQYTNIGLNSELLDRLRNKKPFEFQSQRIPPPRARRSVRTSRGDDDEVFDTLESTNLVRHSNTLSIDSVSSSAAFDESESSSSSSQQSE